jgi:hypothetical protein
MKLKSMMTQVARNMVSILIRFDVIWLVGQNILIQRLEINGGRRL